MFLFDRASFGLFQSDHFNISAFREIMDIYDIKGPARLIAMEKLAIALSVVKEMRSEQGQVTTNPRMLVQG